MNIDDKIKERAVVYERLSENLDWQYLVNEMIEFIELEKEAIVDDLENERVVDKSIVRGMRKVIFTPQEAVEEYKKHSGNN